MIQHCAVLFLKDRLSALFGNLHCRGGITATHTGKYWGIKVYY